MLWPMEIRGIGGVIGTGIMGAPMSGHLAQAGYRVLLHDRDPDRSLRAIATDSMNPSNSSETSACGVAPATRESTRTWSYRPCMA